MPLSAGDCLGPYEIVSRLGKGGTGEVWKARDTRLDWVVTLKTSATGFSEREFAPEPGVYLRLVMAIALLWLPPRPSERRTLVIG